ncbi:hypothetical protein MYCTH_2129497 [Thermothelomyces thermophilus ATCC 42464]|uniref:Uncharacterized protein n=1 Tax=Thermothelomyces thermophilus (strain ATCC 42464 / BCRC 31852 / DSM 1799) TaxID=573729 RepID=G2QIY0_THET4|nr:uncharacterized protein MYCTH_2129497 [Thermothelomyces thermophilus ATCC 42464]AEO60399.1 hypothetical protein MYCTH_2129497 [Thermothelomyces thermophilus ATCC 42464]
MAPEHHSQLGAQYHTMNIKSQDATQHPAPTSTPRTTSFPLSTWSTPKNHPTTLRLGATKPEQHPPKTLPYYARSRGINQPPERLVKKQESAMCYYQRIWWGCGCYFGVILLRRCEHRNTPRCQRRHLLDRWHLATYCPHHRDPPLQLTYDAVATAAAAAAIAAKTSARAVVAPPPVQQRPAILAKETAAVAASD